MLTLIVLILCAAVAALDWLPEIKKRPKKESFVYGLLWTTATAILLLYSFGVDVPSPTDAIRGVMAALFNVK